MSDLAQFKQSHKRQWIHWKKPLDINQLIMGQHPNSGDPYYIAPWQCPLSKLYYCTYNFSSYRSPRRVIRESYLESYPGVLSVRVIWRVIRRVIRETYPFCLFGRSWICVCVSVCALYVFRLSKSL